MRVLVLGISGLIGNTVFNVLSENNSLDVHGSIRSEDYRFFFPLASSNKIYTNVDVMNYDSLLNLLIQVRPDVVINCIGATKHKKEGNDPYNSLALNALYPLILSHLCELSKIRLIHISTDCVFSGTRGFYKEYDEPDAIDIYGRTKAFGELCSQTALVLRTSTIGHELDSSHGLLNWFLSQKDECIGYKNAIFSGFPTVVFAQIIMNHVLANKKLKGLYNVAAEPISKYDLLNLISKIYKKEINIVQDQKVVMDRSLDSAKFALDTGYKPPKWCELIQTMYSFQKNKELSNV
jgi:dTDP-4-dehydrorhamnose reductase